MNRMRRAAAKVFLLLMVGVIGGGAAPADWKSMITIAERKRDAQGNLLPLQSYDETIRRGMAFILKDHLKWFKGPAATLLDEKGHTQMPWVYYSNLQHNGSPFRSSVDRFVSYPAFHHALAIRTFIGYWRYSRDARALQEAVKLADWNIAHSTPGDWAYGNLPYSTFQEKKPGGFRDKTGLMPDKAAIMALAYLQLHEATREARFLRAAKAIGRTLSQRQRPNGTWPFRVDPKTEKVIEEYTSSVIYAIMLFESLDKLNGNHHYRANRDLAWKWLLNGPIKTKDFRGFYEDIPDRKSNRTNYDCLDTIRYLLANRTEKNGYLEMAKDLNAWIEKTFVDKIKGFAPAEGVREQLACNVVMGIHSLNWASMLLELSKATGDKKMQHRAMQTANYITYYLQPDNRIVVGFQYHQWWYSCHTGVVLYLLDFVENGRPASSALYRHYKFDTLIENGAATPDVSPHQAHARLSGQELCEGVIGKALRFKAGNKGVVLGDLGLQAPATLCFWLKTDSSQADGRILSQLEGPTTQSGSLRLTGESLQTWNTQGWPIAVNGLSCKDLWQHVAVVFKKDGTVTGYLNGKKVHTFRSAFDFKGGKAGIGARFIGLHGTPFIGALDDFRIYSSALKDREIKTMYPPELFSRLQAAAAKAAAAKPITPSGKLARDEYLIPVRPGEPNKAPFWNQNAHQFMYAPSFDFPEYKGASRYRFTAQGPYGQNYSFDAKKPYATLKPIWLKIPTGPVQLKVEALDSKGQVLKVSGERKFHRAAMYNGPYHQQLMSYQQSAQWGLRTLFNRKYFKEWMKPGVPAKDYRKKADQYLYPGCPYPAKLMGAIVSGAALYANISPRPADADEVLAIGKKAADYLISLHLPAGTPLEHFPPTYSGKHAKGFMARHNVMMNFPCVTAEAYLDFYDLTKEKKYFEAAKKVADTYQKRQLKQGTWPQVIDNNTGKGTFPTLLNPVKIIRFTDRLVKQYGLKKYANMRDKAFDYLMANTMKTFNWQSQFEDGAPSPLYGSLSPAQACEFADYLFDHSEKNPRYVDMALELMRFSEDQFVSWENPKNIRPGGFPNLSSSNWITPCVSEQHQYMMPVNFSSSHLIETFLKAYQATKKKIYLAKSKDLANTLLVVQKKHKGEYPTYLVPLSADGKFENIQNTWINCGVYTIRAVMRLSDALMSEVKTSSKSSIINGTDWKDIEGRPIQAHDGHITRVGDTFYWYGSSYAGNPGGKFGTAAGYAVWNGIQVYSSKNLVDWTYQGVALARPKKGWGAVGSVGRAHVIYNEKTRKYVMWYWYHTTYPTVFAMVATSDTPVGPFKVMGAREVGSQTGFGSDLNVFKDDDGKAYLVYTDHHTYDETKRFNKGRGVYAILVDSLSDDYLNSNKEGVVAISSKAEAPAMIKHKGKYIVAASGVKGWNPTETRYVLADSPLGPYSKPGIMTEQKTWGGQITSFLYIKESDTLMAMCDQWWIPDKSDLNKSRYLWLPVYVNPQTGVAKMTFHEKWNPFSKSK